MKFSQFQEMVESIFLENKRYTQTINIAPEALDNMQVSSWVSNMTYEFFIRFQSDVAARPLPQKEVITSIHLPDNFVALFCFTLKNKYWKLFPAWLREWLENRSKYKVFETQVQHWHFCPHIHSTERGQHLAFMARDQPMSSSEYSGAIACTVVDELLKGQLWHSLSTKELDLIFEYMERRRRERNHVK